MTSSILFDSTEILNSTYSPRVIQHESIPDRLITMLPIAREDGEVLIAERYGRKTIIVRGTLSAADSDALEAAIDSFKELFSRSESNLDISWNAGTRRYVATCTRHEFNRDHFNINFVPWVAEFVVPSGEGKDTSTTTAVSAEALSVVPATPYDDTTVTISGGKPAKPTITFGGADFASIKGIEYKNTDTGERLIVTYPGDWSAGGDEVIINCEDKTVVGDVVDSVSKPLNFYGVFPEFPIATNNIRVQLGGIVNQKSNDDAASEAVNTLVLNATTRYGAQSFQVPYTDGTFQGIVAVLKKTGSPGSITWRIETDDGGEPSGTLADGSATGTILASAVGGSYGYVTSYASNAYELDANTPYWLVIRTAGTSGGSYYDMGALAESASLYPRGRGKFSVDSGTTWSDMNSSGVKMDFLFRVLFGGGTATEGCTHTVEYKKTYL